MSFNDDTPYNEERTYNCAQCGNPMLRLPHRFRPPKKDDNKAWAVVKFLIDNGFYFQHIYQEGSNAYQKKTTNNYVPYPNSMREAEEFVIK